MTHYLLLSVHIEFLPTQNPRAHTTHRPKIKEPHSQFTCCDKTLTTYHTSSLIQTSPTTTNNPFTRSFLSFDKVSSLNKQTWVVSTAKEKASAPPRSPTPVPFQHGSNSHRIKSWTISANWQRRVRHRHRLALC